MSGTVIPRATAGAPVVLESDALRVTVHPPVGGTIAAIEHKGLGASVLGTTPWQPELAPLEPGTVRDEGVWLTRYGGGWPILFPNGGDACNFDGVFHGFHGEASITPWQADLDAGILRLMRRFATVPVEMRRELAVEGDLLTIRETVRMLGTQPIRVMWGHHPTFGSDLLAGPFEIETGARQVTIDDRYDPANNPLQPGAIGRWPLVPGKAGPFDLSRPEGCIAALACLQDFAGAWASIRRLDGTVGAALSWDADVFPYAWLWYELGGTAEPPWRGRARLIGLEPNTTWPANGLADAARRGGRLLTLQPGTEIATTVRLHVFKPAGAVLGVDAHGRAMSYPAA
jgi:galactose mutarotase-like enzyme